jgi:hypothetical protein
MIRKDTEPRDGKIRIELHFPATTWAESVHLAGDFAWDARKHALVRKGREADWHVALELPLGCSYQFRYLLDGHNWCNDCSADDYAANPSVVTIRWCKRDALAEFKADKGGAHSLSSRPSRKEAM